MKKTSEDEVFEYYQNGLPEDFKIDKSKIVRRKAVDMSKATVQISIKFEHSLLEKVREEAQKKNMPYQTFIKEILKSHLEKESILIEMENIKNRLSLLEAKVS
jgi:predicted DNA binding CopG/RHH family protein